MKKFFLILCAAVAVSAASAQTKDSPLVLTDGVTSNYTVEEAWTHVFYQFTAEVAGSYYVSSDACYEYPYLDSFDSDCLSYGDPAVVDMTAGQTLYIDAYSPSSTEYDMTVVKLSDQGKTADDPVVIAAGGGTYFVNTQQYSKFYFSYTAPKDALLKISTDNYTYLQIDGVDVNLSNYTYKLTVTEGQTYSIVFYYYNPLNVTFTVSELIPGSFDSPLTMEVGENRISGDLTGCWLRYKDAEAIGKLSTSCSNTTTMDSIIVFTSDYYAEQFSNSLENPSNYLVKSAAGSLEVEWTKEDASIEYLVFVGKATSPFATKLNLNLAAFEAGDVKGNAIEPALPYSGEQNAGKKWYKVVCPQSDENKKLNVKATSEIANSATLFAINYGYSSYNAAEGNIGASYEMNTQYGDQTMYVIIDSKEEAPISFTISLDEIEAGDSSAKPIALTSGETYTISKTQDMYYSFTGTQSDLLCFEVSSAAMSVIRYSKSDYYFTEDNSQEGQKYYFNNGNLTSVFRVSGAKAGDTFTFTEMDYPEGASLATAIEFDGTYTFDATTQKIWLKYNVQSECLLHMSSDVEFNDSNEIGYWKTPYDGWTTSIANYNTYTYDKTISYAPGVIYIFAKLVAPAEGKVIKIEELEPAEGEVAAKAITLYNNSTASIAPGATVWYKFEATETGYNKAIINATDPLSFRKYDNWSDVQNDYGYSLSNWGDNHYESYTQEGWNYLCVYNYQNDTVEFTLTGSIAEQPTVGIESLSGEQTGKNIYSIDGRRLNSVQHGLNVVDGQVIINK